MTNGPKARRWVIGLATAAMAAAVGCHSGTEKAIHSHNDTELRNALNDGADPNEVGSHGYTPLIYAARDGKASACQILLQHHADVNAQDNKGSTALMYAAENGQQPIVQMLLDAGANPNLTNNKGYTALAYATANNHAAVADMIRAKGGTR